MPFQFEIFDSCDFTKNVWTSFVDKCQQTINLSFEGIFLHCAKKSSGKGRKVFFWKKGQSYHILKRKNLNSPHLESTFLEVVKTKKYFVNFLFLAFTSNQI
jgi:hypothetical protein